MECENCKWWHRLSSSANEWKNADIQQGECHGAPPTARTEASILNPGGKGGGYWTIHYYEGYFPSTSADDFCGMFCKRESA